MSSEDFCKHLITENTQVPILSTINTKILNERIEDIVPQKILSDLQNEKKRFFHLKKYFKMETKNSKFPKIIIEDKIFDTVNEKCYKTSTELTYLHAEADEINLPDEILANLNNYEMKEKKIIFGKYIESS